KDMPLLKPDRVVINSQNEVLLIDYKTGNKNSSHKKQLETYENAIESMGYKVSKKVLVYIGEHLEVVNLHQI
ncbi:MAG TPA: PD-(D/E)XK nuclease family protein, partial [Flavobacterium sp.]|nr:PD-(D/E)XK nuclease family protein [Flavobacterium sp.]